MCVHSYCLMLCPLGLLYMCGAKSRDVHLSKYAYIIIIIIIFFFFFNFIILI